MEGFTDQDDYLHKPTKHKNWRESFYFNWVDLQSQVSGFSTIGIVPNDPKREFVFALFVKDTPEFYLTEHEDPIPKDYYQALNDGHLSYELVKPFTDWRIHYQSPRLSAEIQWHSRFPACDFGGGSGTSWERHLEQSGTIKGHVEYPDGRTHHFKGFGQRDKSWGRRNWHIDQWFALQAQFDDLMIGLRYDTVKGKGHLSGCVSSAEKTCQLIDIQLKTEFEEGVIRKPIKAHTQLRDKKGRTFTIHSQLIHPVTFARYARPFKGGETELFEEMVTHECEELAQTGTGLAEWLFTHSTKGEIRT